MDAMMNCSRSITNRWPRRIPSGFSLIELVVIIGIIGVLIGVAYPRLATLVPIYRLEGAARNLMMDLQKTRFRAIAEGKCFAVTFDVGARTYQVRSRPGTYPCPTSGYADEEGSARQIDDANAIHIEDANNLGNPPPSPIFDTRGGTSSDQAPTMSTIRLSNNRGGVRTVFVPAKGAIRVQ